MRRESAIIQAALMADEKSEMFAQIERLRSCCTRMQIDVMDGVLVPSRSFPYNTSAFTKHEVLPYADDVLFEVHLMVVDPIAIGEDFVRRGCSRVVAQIEGFASADAKGAIDSDAVREAITAWRAAGAQQVGLSIMLDTPLDVLTPFLDSGEVAYVQVMSIARVGYQGEPFAEGALMRIRTLETRYPHVTISVDGGINVETIDECVFAGADICNVGSALVGAEIPAKAYKELCTAAHIDFC